MVYSGPLNLNVPTTNGPGGFYFDMTLPGTAFTPSAGGQGPAEGLNTVLPGWDFNFYQSTAGLGNTLRWWYDTMGAYAVYNGANHVAPLGAGVMVDGTSPLGMWQTMVPEFAGTTAFMGVEFMDAFEQ